MSGLRGAYIWETPPCSMHQSLSAPRDVHTPISENRNTCSFIRTLYDTVSFSPTWKRQQTHQGDKPKPVPRSGVIPPQPGMLLAHKRSLWGHLSPRSQDPQRRPVWPPYCWCFLTPGWSQWACGLVPSTCQRPHSGGKVSGRLSFAVHQQAHLCPGLPHTLVVFGLTTPSIKSTQGWQTHIASIEHPLPMQCNLPPPPLSFIEG